MLDAVNKITIDVSDPLNTAVVKAVQEDIRSRFVEITLVSNGVPLTIPAGADGMVGIRRPNGTYVLYDQTEDETPAVTFTNNVATVYLSQEALAVAGELYTSVSIYTSTVRLTAFHFVVSVEDTAVPSGVVVESDYFNILEGLVADAVSSAASAHADAERAEQAAAQVVDAVSYGVSQTLTDAQKLTARTNIGAASDAPASTSSAGIVQLYDGSDSTSVTKAATANSVYSVTKMPSRQNLLDNWYFCGGLFPINQRGQSTYSGITNTVDRWKIPSATGSVSVTSNGIIVSTSSSAAADQRRFEQRMEDFPNGIPFVVSILVSNVSGSFEVVVGSISDSSNRIGSGTFTSGGLITVSGTMTGITDGMVSFINRQAGTNTVTIIAAKMELGTEQTLCYWDGSSWQLRDYPNYAEQLIRCQRFQYLLPSGTSNGAMAFGYGGSSTVMRVCVPIPTPLYKEPTVVFLRSGASSLVFNGNGGTVNASAISSISYVSGSCYIGINATVSGATQNQCYTLRTNTADILFDANL